MKKLGTKILETERLLLRPFRIDDVENVFNNYAKDDEVTKFLSWPTHQNKDVTKEFLTSVIDSYADLNTYNWAIVLNANDEVIGSISVVKMQANKNQIEIGYVLGKAYWNQGIMSEALKKVLEYFTKEVKVNKILLKCNSKNLASRKVAENAGMIFDSIEEKAGKDNTGVCDTAVYHYQQTSEKI